MLGRRGRGAAIVVVIVAMLGSGRTAAQATSTAAVASVRRAAPPAVQWQRCHGVAGARCGHVVVPFDPRDLRRGTISIGFELHARTDRSRANAGTLVATEGGPGYSTTSSRSYYLDLYRSLHVRHDVLFVDNRGTGMSAPINCPALQLGTGDYEQAVGACGRQLGDRADGYGSAFAADDLASVLDALHIGRVDLYGDSYGTFFAQTFAVRHPDRLRTLVLDSAYPVEDQDPWYRDLNRAMRDALHNVCARATTTCSGDTVARIAKLAQQLDAHPVHGRAPGSDGLMHEVTIDGVNLALIVANATYGGAVYRELDAAARAALAGDAVPLLRLGGEYLGFGLGEDAPRDYSAGLYIAVICNDYPQLWNRTAPLGATRETQYKAALARLRATQPDAFAPFTIADWNSSTWSEPRTCIQWPRPHHYQSPLPSPHQYPKVPTLVLSGDLDSITSREGARKVAAAFPNSTFVAIANGIHVMGLADFGHCASMIIVRFVASGGNAGDTSCAAQYPEVHAVARFDAQLGTRASDAQVVGAAAGVAGDVLDRWFANYSGATRGLRGGTVTIDGSQVIEFAMRGYRVVNDFAVSGTLTWNRRSGAISASLRSVTPAGAKVVLTIRWNAWNVQARASVDGTIGGRRVATTIVAP